MQRSTELAAAKQSWLSQKIPRKRIPAILNLLPVKDEVLALAGMDKAGLKQSFGALTKDVLALNGVNAEVLHAEFMAAERYCYDPRNSIVSSAGSTLSGSSIFSQASSRSSLSSMISQYSGQPDLQQKFFCPSCGGGYGRSNDMVNHMRKKCEEENLVRYKCYDCNAVEEIKGRMRTHVEEAHPRTSPGPEGRDPLGFGEFELPAKRSFGCPHCETSFDTLSDYHDHLIQQHFLKEKINNRGSPSLRVRNGIRAAGLAGALQNECKRRHMHADTWELFEWDDVNAWWFWDRLEYGVRDPDVDPFSYMGIEDPRTFVTALIDRAQNPSNDNIILTALIEEASRPGFTPRPQNVPPESPSTTPGPSIALPVPPAAYHPRVERLRNTDKLPVRNSHSHPRALQPAPPPSHAPATASPEAATTLSRSAFGHKHHLSAGSLVHPDGTDRSRNSPASFVEEPLQVPSGAAIAQQPQEPQLDWQTYNWDEEDLHNTFFSSNSVFFGNDPSFTPPPGMTPQSFMEWDDAD